MSTYAGFRRQPVQQNYAQQLKTMTMPAPTRGIVLDESEAFMKPGACLVSDNWFPTLRGLMLRGGCVRHCDLHSLDATVPPVPSALRQPVISAFEYAHANDRKMFAAQQTKLFEVTATVPVLVKSGQADGNYSAAQMATSGGGDYLIALNDAGDFPLRFNGLSWVTLDPGAGAPTDGASAITYPVATLPPGVPQGKGLVYVWKYRNRLFFIQAGSMNAWYLGIDAVGGELKQIPLSGAASRGGSLLFGATWSMDAGDGIDDKCVFVTDLGDVIIFTGSDPGNPGAGALGGTGWSQQGVYHISPPLGKNAHINVGGEMLIMTVDGIVPLSQSISLSVGQLELAMVTRTIKPLWREAVDAHRLYPWSMEKWDELGGMFIAVPGGVPGKRFCLTVNNASGAWARTVGWDVMCFIRMRDAMFFGTQDGIIMQADRTGYDDGVPYVATMVGGWEMFQSRSQMTTWHQARAIFTTTAGQPFQPQISATTDYVVTLPPPPPPGPDPGLAEVWDQGLWDHARWDQPSLSRPPTRNTMWVSVGMTGFSHAPIIQVTVAQQAKPNVELVALAATYEVGGVNV